MAEMMNDAVKAEAVSLKREESGVPDSESVTHDASSHHHMALSAADSVPAVEETVSRGQVLPEQPKVKVIRRQISGYVGFANLPKQWHRKSIRRGFNLNLLCVGYKGLGKSTLINTLFNRELYEQDNLTQGVQSLDLSDSNTDTSVKKENGEEDSVHQPKVKIETVSAEIEENGVKLQLTVVDAPGFGDSIDNTDSWKPIVDEINRRFDQYLESENKIQRSVLQDNRIHACLYFIEPTGHGLKQLDLEFCKQVHSKCNLIPIIAKSDILTDEEILSFKATIKKQLEQANVQLFEPPQYFTLGDDGSGENENIFEKIPFAVVGSTEQVTTEDGRRVRGRAYPWGVIEVDNTKHSDFVYLRDLLIRQYLEELRERTNKVLYEKYRSEKLIGLGIKQDNSVFKSFDPETRQKEEKQLHEVKLAKLEAEMKAVFQQKVEEKEKKLQKSEAELFARHKELKDKLTSQLKALEEKKRQLELSLANQPSNSPVPAKKKGFLR